MKAEDKMIELRQGMLFRQRVIDFWIEFVIKNLRVDPLIFLYPSYIHCGEGIPNNR